MENTDGLNFNHVRIVYKSGYVANFAATELEFTSNGGTGRSMTWANAVPRPLFANVSDVESIWDLGPIANIDDWLEKHWKDLEIS
ncbi:hypothetical protein SEA_SIXAMA_24 [Gordonia phage Sixama]|uniref:Uncharacterized protein n=1 Tax=Gordonia phage Sixama TaxID=2653271 RepID=A0A5Q2F661_9CAUD|nr:hypothetical protein PP302_gp024 [Gordonia phage Sixama]QGF20203.1 hypothetical protein SEA_SIXAMA_24 [Gordonia phage Sixama]